MRFQFQTHLVGRLDCGRDTGGKKLYFFLTRMKQDFDSIHITRYVKLLLV